MISKELLDNYKKKLEEERAVLEEELRELEKAPDFGDSAADLETEEVDEAEEFATNLAMIQPLKERLIEVEDALSKIINGGYGVCEKCDSEIDEKLLGVNPESRLCKNCNLKRNS